MYAVVERVLSFLTRREAVRSLARINRNAWHSAMSELRVILTHCLLDEESAPYNAGLKQFDKNRKGVTKPMRFAPLACGTMLAVTGAVAMPPLLVADMLRNVIIADGPASSASAAAAAAAGGGAAQRPRFGVDTFTVKSQGVKRDFVSAPGFETTLRISVNEHSCGDEYGGDQYWNTLELETVPPRKLRTAEQLARLEAEAVTYGTPIPDPEEMVVDWQEIKKIDVTSRKIFYRRTGSVEHCIMVHPTEHTFGFQISAERALLHPVPCECGGGTGERCVHAQPPPLSDPAPEVVVPASVVASGSESEIMMFADLF